MRFVRFSEETAFTSLYSIYWLIFITETESVYYAVRTNSLSVIELITILKILRLLDEVRNIASVGTETLLRNIDTCKSV
jgi:hypothetical protein